MEKQIKEILNLIEAHDRRITTLEQLGEKNDRIEKKEMQVHPNAPTSVDFSINARAFFRHHAEGLSGPKKFVLVLAYVTQGSLEQQKAFENISNQWKKVEGLLEGKIQKMYSTRAKEKDWIDSPKKGMYVLRPKWLEIFS